MRKKEESLKEFVAEAEEIVEGLGQNLMELESSPDKSSPRPETINSIFRAAHTLKGMAGMVGLAKTSELSHRMEDMLDRLRMGRLALSGPVMDALFQSVEGLRQLVGQINTGKGETMDTAAVIQKIDRAMNAPAAADASPGDADAGLSPELLKVLTEYETHRLKENIRLKANLFEVTARFKLETFDKDLAALNKKLQSLGEVISTLPSSGLSPADGIAFTLLVGTRTDHEMFREQLSGDPVEIKPVGAAPPPETKAAPPAEEAAAPVAPKTEEQQEATSSIRSISPTVRVDIGQLDALLNVVGELVLSKAVIHEIGKEMLQSRGFDAHVADLQKATQMLDRRVSELQEGLVGMRMIPIGQIFDRLVRVVRKLSKDLGKEVNLRLSGEETKLDKSMIEELADPMLHLIRNALDHGMESRQERLKAGKPEVGTISLRAMQRGNNVVVEIEDDGRGVDLARVYHKGLERGLLDKNKEYTERELLNVLFQPGFSTAEKVTELSGRGVGLDVVAKNITRLSGLVDVETEMGKGTRFSITLPITLVIIKALVVRVGRELYAIPLNSVSESLMIVTKDIQTVERREVIHLRQQTLSLLRLQTVFGADPPEEKRPDRLYVIVVGLAEKRLGLVVDAIEGQQEIVIKSLGGVLQNIPGIAGATELGNRKTILVFDVGGLIEGATHSPSRRPVST
jgi:two-component system chemotaxis sensor kinase CheA